MQDPNGYGVGPEWPAMAGVEAKASVEIWVYRIVQNTLRHDRLDDMVERLHQTATLSDADLDKPAIHGQNNLKASVNAWQPNITSRNVEWHNMARHSTAQHMTQLTCRCDVSDQGQGLNGYPVCWYQGMAVVLLH